MPGALTGDRNDRKGTREQQLRDAICTARGLTLADFKVFSILLWTANFGTAELPGRFQPRSLVHLADKCRVSLATVKRSIGHLQRHGWLERHRNITDAGIGGRGHPTRYKLLIGRDCDCQEEAHGEPVPAGKPAHDEPINRLTGVPVAAGRTAFPDGRAATGERREGNHPGAPVGWGWPPGSEGAAANGER